MALLHLPGEALREPLPACPSFYYLLALNAVGLIVGHLADREPVAHVLALPKA